jgi:hypothetical protein
MLGAEAIHLGAGLGDDHFGYPPVDARRAIQAIDVVITSAVVVPKLLVWLTGSRPPAGLSKRKPPPCPCARRGPHNNSIRLSCVAILCG